MLFTIEHLSNWCALSNTRRAGSRRTISSARFSSSPLFAFRTSSVNPMLYDFIATHRQELITRCQVKAAARLPVSNAAEEYGVPLFLNQLMEALRLGLRSNPDIGQSALRSEEHTSELQSLAYL